MPTDVTSTIAATSTPTTPDYTSLSAWEDAAPVNLVTDDKRWIGQCLDQGKFTSGINFGGSTVDSTRYKFLTTGSGASFKDKAGVRTTALNYNSTTGNGVAIETSGVAVDINEDDVHLEGLQIKRTGYNGDQGVTRSSNGARVDINKCIIHSQLNSMSSTTKVKNSLLLRDGTGTAIMGQCEVYNCTVIRVGASGAAFQSAYNNMVLKNVAVFAHTSISSDTFRAGSNYNATDLASGLPGANSVHSLTYADQFENTASDWRAKSTGGLDAGTPDATNAPDDISDLDRDDTTPWIGCWEVAAAAGGAAKDLLRSNLLKSRLLKGLAA